MNEIVSITHHNYFTLQHGYGRGTPQVKRLVGKVGSVVNLFSYGHTAKVHVTACN